jgi:anaerobic ribonucleoside-triphosphate reductase activating protein
MEKTQILLKTLQIASISTGFSEIPGEISLNIYAQGCKLRCEGCQNPELQQFNAGSTLKIQDFIPIINKNTLCNWICWLGGDVIYQPEGLLAANSFFKEHGYKICLYTGIFFRNIDKNILSDIDLVIDGPWKGIPITDKNTNQRTYIKRDGKWVRTSFKKLGKQ